MAIGTDQRTAHDIRTILGIVIGNVQLLQDSEPLSPEQQKYASRILQGCREIAAMMDASSVRRETRTNEQ